MFQKQIEAIYPGMSLKVGFPDRKVEAYRKVPLQVITNATLTEKGKESLDLSEIPSSIVALKMEEAKKTYALFLENRRKEKAAKESDFFAALTEAVSENGYFFYIPANVVIEEPIPLKMNYSGKNSCFFPYIQIFVGRGAKVSFQFKPVFTNFEKGMISQIIDLCLDKDAFCNFVDETDIPVDAFYIQSIRSSLKRKSSLNYWSISKGSHFFRQDFKIELLEEESEVSLKGATYLCEKNVSHTQVLIEHKAPHAKSNQHFKAVMNDQSSSTFEGKIFVVSEAQQTEAYQLNNNLLLGSKSSAFSKPNLEIFADDVKASHGATVANLSEEELLYFQARGISREVARKTLAKGFLDEITRDAFLCNLIQK